MKNNAKERKSTSIKNTMIKILTMTGFLFVLFLVGILGAVRGIVTDIAGKYTLMTSQRLENQLEVLYEKMDVYAMNISREECVRAFLTNADGQLVKNLNEVKEVLAYYQILEPAITDIAFVNDHIHYSSIYMDTELDEIMNKYDLKAFSWLETRYSSFISHKNEAAQLVYSLPIMENGNYIGTILLSLNSETLQIDDKSIGQSLYMLADKEHVVFSFNADGEQAVSVWNVWKKLGFTSGKEKNYVIRSVYSEAMRCWQISALDCNQVYGNMKLLTGMIYGCVFLIACFLTVIIVIILRQVVYPLRRFQKKIRDMIEGQGKRYMEPTIQGIGGCEEIEKIREDFNHLMEEQKQLNHRIFNTASDLYETKIQKQQAELSYLRSQIDPHFLYNTLEAIRKMALLRKAPEIAEMAVDMGKIFRYSTKGAESVSLNEEIEMIKSYVRIQQMRFGTKIRVFYSVSDEVLEYRVVKMLMQPVVENAIIHGLEPKEAQGSLFIAARSENGALYITIKDDGVGISAEKLKKIQEDLEQEVYDTSVHVGILNTQARIRLKYGREYGLRVESVQGDGTTILIRVPCDRGK